MEIHKNAGLGAQSSESHPIRRSAVNHRTAPCLSLRREQRLEKPQVPPGISHEYQKKGFTDFAFCNCLILLGDRCRCKKSGEAFSAPEEKKREQAPALHTQLSTG